MARLQLPDLHTVLVLQQDWTFTLSPDERAHDAFARAYGLDAAAYSRGYWGTVNTRQVPGASYAYPVLGWVGRISAVVTLPAGTELSVKRIFLRQGMKKNHVTLRVGKCDSYPKLKGSGSR